MVKEKNRSEKYTNGKKKETASRSSNRKEHDPVFSLPIQFDGKIPYVFLLIKVITKVTPKRYNLDKI